MKFGPVPLDEAEGQILGHNIADQAGNRLMRKGRPITTEQIARLRTLGRSSVYVAHLEPDDIGEDAAARAIAAGVLGPGLRSVGAAGGRVNLLAGALGVARVDRARVDAINAIEGVTLATVTENSAVERKQITATIKIIPFAVPSSALAEALQICTAGPLARIDALAPTMAALILSGSPSARERIISDFDAPIRRRLAALNASLNHVGFVPLDDEAGEAALAAEIAVLAARGFRIVVLAGETAIMDAGDIAPRAVTRAGGVVTVYGAPVDPGNLLMVGYVGAMAVLGAPGCARSPKINVVDYVMPRLLVGDRITRADISGLGVGGLLEEIAERPSPRNV
jgi:molybdenum cofactor cytidylyltransferase